MAGGGGRTGKDRTGGNSTGALCIGFTLVNIISTWFINLFQSCAITMFSKYYKFHKYENHFNHFLSIFAFFSTL